MAGIYVNEEEYPPKIIRVNYVNNKRLEFSTFEDSIWSKPVLYKEKFDKKRSTFERWVHRKIYPFIICYRHEFEKDRIGKDYEGNLIINNASNWMGIVPLFANGSRGSIVITYQPLKDQLLIPSKMNNKWGYKDFLSKDFVIANVYDWAYSFQGSLARVKVGSKWGIINKENDFVVKPKYNEIESLEDGTMKIRKDGKWGLLDSIASEVVPCIYDKIYSPRRGFRKVFNDNLCGLIDRNSILYCLVNTTR